MESKLNKFKVFILGLFLMPMAVYAGEVNFNVCSGSGGSPYMLNRPIIFEMGGAGEQECGQSLSFSNNGLAGNADPATRRMMDESCGYPSRNCGETTFDPNNFVNSPYGPLYGPNLSRRLACPYCEDNGFGFDRTPSSSGYSGDSSSGYTGNEIPPTDMTEIEGFTPWNEYLSSQVRSYVTTDNAPVGYCGRGTTNILANKLCIDNAPSGHGYMWGDVLANRSDFREVNCEPDQCPPGTIISYMHNTPRPATGSTGRRWGHIEIVTSDGNGGRTFCSSHCQTRWGGSVPHNRRRMFVYIGSDRCGPR